MAKTLFILAAVAILVQGCATTPLQQYMTDHKYETFDIPRSGSGVGVIVSYPSKTEQIEAERSECLPEVEVPKTHLLITLPSYEFEKESNLESKIFANSIAGGKLSLTGAFKDARVKKVKISFVEPFEEWITPLSIEQYTKSNKLSDACRNRLRDRNNYVILRVVGAKGIIYQFIDENNQTLQLDTKFLEMINANTSYTDKLKSKEDLKSESEMLFGYRLWQLKPTLDPREAWRLRNKNNSR